MWGRLFWEAYLQLGSFGLRHGPMFLCKNVCKQYSRNGYNFKVYILPSATAYCLLPIGTWELVVVLNYFGQQFFCAQ